MAQGAGPLRVMFGEILPNLASTIIVFFTLMIANSMLFEAACPSSARRAAAELVLGDDDHRRDELLNAAAAADDVPGSMIMLTVLSLNVFGDALRDALDPRGKAR